MTPALTKILKDGHGIHLSSPPASVRMDSDGRAMCSTELESQMRSTDDGDIQKMWLNLSLFPSLDSSLPVSPLDDPANPLLSSCPQASASQFETLLFPSPASLLSFLSFSKGLRDSHQVAPGVPDMFLVPEHNSQEACLLHGCNATPECGTDGGDVYHSSHVLSSVPPSYSSGEISSLDCTPFFAPPPTETKGKVAGMGCPHPSPVQPYSGKVNSNQLAFRAVLDAAVKEQLSRQRGLQSRAQRLQRRLHALLGEHALLHCNHQLEGLERHCQVGGVSLDSLDSIHYIPQVGDNCSWVELSTDSSSFIELREFNLSSQAVLRGLQEALDSEATASSSSEEEQEEDKIYSKTKTSPFLLNNALWIVSKPLPGTFYGRFLLEEDISLLETQQSAQLSQIVNSLMLPLSFSPPSKQPQPHTWKGKRAFTSGQKGDCVFVPGSSKRRRLATRRLFKADVSCVCARTRPLVTYHKPKLFTFNTCNPSSSQDSGKSTSTLSSSLSASSCSSCSSCDPVVLCPDPDCSSSRALYSRTPGFTSHPVLSFSYDTPRSHHLNRVLTREEWIAGSAQSRHRRANQKKRKTTHIHRLIEDEEDILYQRCDSSDEVLEEGFTQASRKHASQGFVRKRQGESKYNINNIVIPMSLAKVEKLQYKDILTPSWRVVDTSSLNSEAEKEEGNEEGQVEDLTNKVFSLRHLDLEQREKLRWPSLGKRKCCRLPKRSGSRLSGSGGGMCTSGEESSVELSCAQLDTDEQQSSEEWLPQTPWDPRVFPLGEDEEDALHSDNREQVPLGWLECSAASSTSKNSNSHLSPAPSSGATLPCGGLSQSCTPNGS
ncbi:hypothetical protein FQN60_001466 [Etheostoma spectabile]|uniref:PEHE domain-containing protein n=1 Tax=Etheostoma spectabile TaxID=54343 RepID=A0A5J5D0R6_9PERO|nr:hypothetical protein FQN60_001466 [Etheostoma spectabile]